MQSGRTWRVESPDGGVLFETVQIGPAGGIARATTSNSSRAPLICDSRTGLSRKRCGCIVPEGSISEISRFDGIPIQICSTKVSGCPPCSHERAMFTRVSRVTPGSGECRPCAILWGEG